MIKKNLEITLPNFVTFDNDLIYRNCFLSNPNDSDPSSSLSLSLLQNEKWLTKTLISSFLLYRQTIGFPLTQPIKPGVLNTDPNRFTGVIVLLHLHRFVLQSRFTLPLRGTPCNRHYGANSLQPDPSRSLYPVGILPIY